MPIYPLRCTAGHTWEQFYKAADKPTACDRVVGGKTCGAPCESDYARLNVTGCVKRDRRMADKRESLLHFHDPRDVTRIRGELGKAGSYVKDDGTVVFPTRKAEREYTAAKNAMKRRERERANDREMHERAEVKKGNMVEVTEPLSGTPSGMAAPMPAKRRTQRDPKRIDRGRTKGRVAT